MKHIKQTRRDFLKSVVIAGVSVYFAPLAGAASREQDYLYKPQAPWADGSKAKFRMDAIQKVTGQKVFARDFRAKDFPHWPDSQWHGYIVCATDTDHLFEDIDLSFLAKHPTKVIMADDLASHHITLPTYHGDEMLLAKGKVAHFIGHPVAMLLFDSFDDFNAAKSRLDFNATLVKYGAKVTPFERDPYAAWRVIRIAQDRTEGRDAFSVFQDGLFFPAYQLRQPKWPTEQNIAGTLSERGMYYADRINKEMADPSAHVIDTDFQTQIVDPMMLEPEAANVWYDQQKHTLHGAITCQDPTDFSDMAVHLLKASTQAKAVESVVLYSGFVGGAFGAKDHSVFPFYALAASLFCDGNPIRIANDRYQQFQQGLKRHPFNIHNRLSINKETLKIEALTSQCHVDGGGRENFSASVASAGMSAMQGVFYIPQSDLQATAYHSRNVTSGSMRGYGSAQCMPIIDLMIGQAAHELNVDPFELRRQNLLRTGDLNTQGAEIDGEIRYQELLDKAELHPIWQNRAVNKREFEANHPNKSFGVGYSLLAKNYGTGNVGPNAAVNLTAKGEIVLEIEYMEMGSGAQTSQGLLTHEFFGHAAGRVDIAVTETWAALQLFETDNPYTISQEKQDKMSTDPRWTLIKLMASSASDSATFQTEATKGACAVVYRYGILPAARKLWGMSLDSDLALAKWEAGKLTLMGQKPLDLHSLAKTAHDHGFVTGSVAHTVNRWAWTQAEFTIEGDTQIHSLDAIAVRYGEGASAAKKQSMDSLGYHLIERNWVKYPSTQFNNAMVTYYAPCDCLIELAVDRHTGEVDILRTHSVLDAGPVISTPIVEGQIQGGLVMGLGHVLHEYLPPFEAGAGSGTWNLHRYRVPCSKDVNVWQMGCEILPPSQATDRPKGIAEVVMLPVISAVQDAIFNAIGERFTQTPITAAQIKTRLKP
ncbi:xanthine dehydrogenase family protein molybdopterin-binding subunit [Shewanella sp. VB17]|uniref:xanthine dehydrogenase family protein molybdopterin-binding subunit n=1 Tax=Shewanella sp. VB17 TaxID=2739432 RepID=UPI0015630218|nr:molybdopterin cofactor-binding domain-containing protein [Shewanella sp. VB17]NRD74151.1 xanthine dehydrogenase family protein molybdopterin-binding subunit [Shewanella sp. VB17]